MYLIKWVNESTSMYLGLVVWIDYYCIIYVFSFIHMSLNMYKWLIPMCSLCAHWNNCTKWANYTNKCLDFTRLEKPEHTFCEVLHHMPGHTQLHADSHTDKSWDHHHTHTKQETITSTDELQLVKSKKKNLIIRHNNYT